MTDDLAWAQASPEVGKHAGKFVVVYQKRVLAVGADREALLEKAARKAGCPKYELVVKVVPPRTLEESPH
jgi:hypothetical protein